MKRVYVNYPEHQYFTSWEKANECYNMLATSEKEFLQKWVGVYDGDYEDIDNECNVIYIDWENWAVFESSYELLAENFTDIYITSDDIEEFIEEVLACKGDNDKLLQQLYGTRVQKIIIK